MFSPFVMKLQYAMKFHIVDGKIKILDKEEVMISPEALIQIQKEIEEKLGEEGNKIIYNAGKNQAKEVLEYCKKITGFEKIKLQTIALDLMQTYGFGKFEVINLDWNNFSVVLHVYESAICKVYRDKFGIINKPINHFLAGFLAGAYNVIFGNEVECKENLCIASGSSYCEFIIKRGEK
jgi:predicted hydrocarbon binding protein